MVRLQLVLCMADMGHLERGWQSMLSSVQSGGAIVLRGSGNPGPIGRSNADLSSCTLSGNSAGVQSCGLGTTWNDVRTPWWVVCVADMGQVASG